MLKIVGHRGAAGLAPENTLDSIKKALECAVDEIEIDVRVSHNGNVHLSHDPIDDSKNLALLVDAIKLVNKKIPLMIEVKPGESVGPIVMVIKDFLKKGWQDKDFLLGSFSQKTLLELHQHLPQIPKVVIESWSGLRATRRARQLGTKRLSMNQRWLWSGFIRAMKQRGFELYPYTLNNPTKAKGWQKYGIAGVITDRPDRFLLS